MAKINNHSSILVDISRSGFKFSTAAIPKSRNVDITLQANNQVFNLKGYTRWISQKVATQQLYEIGVTIKEASQEYYQFLDQILPEITMPVEQPHTHHGQPQLAGGFDMIAGQDAQASGVEGQAFMDAEFRGEVGNHHVI